MFRSRLTAWIASGAIALVLAMFAVPAARAGVACSLLVSSESSTTPETSAVVRVGEDVYLDGQFQPGAEVTLTFTFEGQPVEEFVGTAEADGTFSIVIGFEAEDVGTWEVIATTDDEVCGDVAILMNVAPAGPFTSVSLVTALCPVAIQSAEDLAAAGAGACAGAVLPADEPTVPDGYTAVNLEVASFDLVLSSSDGVSRSLDGALLDGGGTCNPATLECTFGYAYRWDYAAVGATEVAAITPPAGYRLGQVTVTTTSDPPQPTGSPVIDAGNGAVTFELGQEQVIATTFWFADAAVAPTPAPTAPAPAATSTPSAAELPDTTVAVSDGSGLAAVVAALLLLVAGGGLVWKLRGRPPIVVHREG